MRKFLTFLFVALSVVACNNEYDDSAVWNSINALEQKTQAMESLLNAQKNKLTIRSVKTLANGYIITFSDGSTATITNG